ncbi:Uncharacterised protein [Vibrio cholerae]|nr:Uncharacterised protein [Vibrio cholerae]
MVRKDISLSDSLNGFTSSSGFGAFHSPSSFSLLNTALKRASSEFMVEMLGLPRFQRPSTKISSPDIRLLRKSE